MEILNVRIEEALRYMGFKNNKPNEAFMKIVYEVEKELLKSALPKYTYEVFDILNNDLENGRVTLNNCNLVLSGFDIANHLKGCKKAVLMACTASAGVDKLMRVYSVSDMTKAVVCDSMASALVEQICDEAQKEISQKISGYTTFRFSCGYGDFPLETQREIINILDARKKIGVSVTDSMLLTPQKSVTAVFGVRDEIIEKKRMGCETCNLNKTCKFRKRGERCEF